MLQRYDHRWKPQGRRDLSERFALHKLGGDEVMPLVEVRIEDRHERRLSEGQAVSQGARLVPHSRSAPDVHDVDSLQLPHRDAARDD